MKRMKAILLSIFFGICVWMGSELSAQNYPLVSEDLIKPRMRVMIDNDFGGDPDGLFQLAHHILSPSVEIRGIIGSQIKPGGFFNAPETAANACSEVNHLLKIMNLSGRFPVYEGSDSALIDLKTPQLSEGAKAIVKEAMREDTDLPLFIVCGGGLTDIASAYLIEPEIARHLTLIWIGGPEYPDLALPPPGSTNPEYNLNIDIPAGQIIFNNSDIPLWQVPRNVYRQPLMAYSELLLKVKPAGTLGEYLANKMDSLLKETQNFNVLLGETYILGDSPLVLLTALQSPYNADPSSSNYILKPAPKINDSGFYEANSSARNIRIYTSLDTRLMFEDFFSKLALFNAKAPN